MSGELPPDAVIFDWGGTLTPWHTVDVRATWLAYAQVYADDTAGAELLAERLHLAEEEAWAAGRDQHTSASIGDVFRAAGVQAEGATHARALAEFQRTWEPHTWTDPEARPMLEALRTRGLRVGILSNTLWSRDHHELVLERDGVLDLFDGAVYTSEIPWTKPHPEAFRAAMAAVGADDPARVVFVGDRPLRRHPRREGRRYARRPRPAQRDPGGPAWSHPGRPGRGDRQPRRARPADRPLAGLSGRARAARGRRRPGLTSSGRARLRRRAILPPWRAPWQAMPRPGRRTFRRPRPLDPRREGPRLPGRRHRSAQLVGDSRRASGWPPDASTRPGDRGPAGPVRVVAGRGAALVRLPVQPRPDHAIRIDRRVLGGQDRLQRVDVRHPAARASEAGRIDAATARSDAWTDASRRASGPETPESACWCPAAADVSACTTAVTAADAVAGRAGADEDADGEVDAELEPDGLGERDVDSPSSRAAAWASWARPAVSAAAASALSVANRVERARVRPASISSVAAAVRLADSSAPGRGSEVGPGVIVAGVDVQAERPPAAAVATAAAPSRADRRVTLAGPVPGTQGRIARLRTRGRYGYP